MNLQQLRYVVATADAGSMTAAARAVPVAQPALSRAVRALEAELGVELFATRGRSVELTESGFFSHRKSDDGYYWVAPLYRAALDIKPGKSLPQPTDRADQSGRRF